MRRTAAFFILILLLKPLQVFTQDLNPTILDIINEVNLDSIKTCVSELSGVIPVMIDDAPYTIASRYNSSDGNVITPFYLKQRFEGYGFTVQFQDFNTLGRNVYAMQAGTEYPGRIYIICAHYDDAPSGLVAPGADDNASGTSAVLEAARILHKYQTSYSILYALWDNEEQGLLGSANYASEAYARGDTIMGVINLDMIGWDSNGDMVMDIHTNDVANSLALSDTVKFVNSSYGIGLSPVVKNPGSGSSDHASFWSVNYGAVMLIESYPGDFNAHYHSTLDLLSALNDTFYLRNTKLAVGTLAVLSSAPQATGVESSGEVAESYALDQNYPNPFNPTTVISYRLSGLSRVKLEIYDMLGRCVKTLVDDIQPEGNYSVVWNASGFSSGIYIYRLKAGDFLQTKLMALVR